MAQWLAAWWAGCTRLRWLASYILAHKNVPGFMKNLYLSFCTDPSFERQQACGLQRFFFEDVSSRSGCYPPGFAVYIEFDVTEGGL